MKIIRDKLKDVIDADRLVIEPENKKQMSQFLIKKVQEELQEIIDSKMKDPEEYADLIQVVLDMARVNGIEDLEILKANAKKFQEKGGFTGGVYLK